MKCGGAGELNLMLDGCICPEPLEVGVSFTVEGIFHSGRNHKGNSDLSGSRIAAPSFSSSSRSSAAELCVGCSCTGLASSC